MRTFVMIAISLLVAGLSCVEPNRELNPFFQDFETPLEVPPFEQIQTDHYLPAFEAGIEQHKHEIEAIVSSKDPATFENTIEALEYSGGLLRKVSRVFFNLNSAMTNDEMQTIAKKVAPMLAKHQDDILLDPALFSRVATVYEQLDKLDLTPEGKMLLEETYRDFVRGGAKLDESGKSELRKINEELSVLSVRFGENVLKENNAFEMVIESEEDLEGLPDSVIAAAAEAARDREYRGKWLFTLDKPSLIPFLQFSSRRDLREKMLKGYITRGDHGNEFDNNEIAIRIAELRARRAALLGYTSHADYVLEKAMAKEPEAVYELLNRVWEPARAVAVKEAAALQELIKREGGDFKLQPWDWWYFAEKIRKEKYDLDEEQLRPYFQLENVRNGAFEVAKRLYGLTFEERTDLPVYHQDVKTFEVKEADGSHVGILYVDYFPRPSKRGGAWMNSFRKHAVMDGQRLTPVISNVCNFSKPVGDRPALLSLEEVRTLFHEFGHALHGLLSKCVYDSQSGTAVPRDFVELPSQIMENWAIHPEVLKMYARHFETGEVIPDELIDKIQAARKFNQGFATVEYLAAAFLDMDWHTLPEGRSVTMPEFENESMSRIGLIPEIVVRYRSPYFSHIFSGGYSAGYYSYIWAEVLDADAFQAFREKGLFDQATARSFRENILARGGSEDPMTLYRRFRGSDPKIEPLLERRGLN